MHYSIAQPTTSDSLELAKVHNQAWIETYPNEELGITKQYIGDRIAGRLSKEGLERRESAINLSHDKSTYFLRIATDESVADRFNGW